MTKCNSCGGTYASALTDGTRYFHACPPLSDPEVIAALGLNQDRTKWTALEGQTFAAAPRVRPNARNENVPDVVQLKAAIAAVPKTDEQTYWPAVNKAVDTAIAAAGAGTTIV